MKISTLVQSKRRPDWGFGIVLEVDATKASVFFNDGETRKLILSMADLEILEESEVPLDALVRHAAGRKDLTSKRSVSTRIIDLVTRFNSVFPDMFDAKFDHDERDYKMAAKQRLHEKLEPAEMRQLLEQGQAVEVMKRATRVIAATNLVYKIEMLKFRDVPAGAAPDAAAALCDLLEASDDQVPDRVAAFAKVLDPWEAGKWPIVTYFPFLQRPDRMPFVKPYAVQQAASALGYDIGYRSEPSATTYRRIIGLHDLVKREMGKHDLVPRDLIDVQTFLWYGCGLGTAHVAKDQA